MGRFRFTMARWMVVTGVFALNAGLVRAFMVEEKISGGILIFLVLQVGLWRFLRSRGPARRFWLGFEISGVASVLALFACEVFPALTRLAGWYVDTAFNLVFSCLPTLIDDLVMERQDGFLVVVYFLPELLASVMGGIVALRLDRMGRTRARHSFPPAHPSGPSRLSGRPADADRDPCGPPECESASCPNFHARTEGRFYALLGVNRA